MGQINDKAWGCSVMIKTYQRRFPVHDKTFTKDFKNINLMEFNVPLITKILNLLL